MGPLCAGKQQSIHFTHTNSVRNDILLISLTSLSRTSSFRRTSSNLRQAFFAYRHCAFVDDAWKYSAPSERYSAHYRTRAYAAWRPCFAVSSLTISKRHTAQCPVAGSRIGRNGGLCMALSCLFHFSQATTTNLWTCSGICSSPNA